MQQNKFDIVKSLTEVLVDDDQFTNYEGGSLNSQDEDDVDDSGPNIKFPV